MTITLNNFFALRFFFYSKNKGIGYSFINRLSICPNIQKIAFKACICNKKVDKLSFQTLSSVCPFVHLSKMGKVGQSYFTKFVHINKRLQFKNKDFERFGQKDNQNGKKNPIYTFFKTN